MVAFARIFPDHLVPKMRIPEVVKRSEVVVAMITQLNNVKFISKSMITRNVDT